MYSCFFITNTYYTALLQIFDYVTKHMITVHVRVGRKKKKKDKKSEEQFLFKTIRWFNYKNKINNKLIIFLSLITNNNYFVLMMLIYQ